MYLDMVSKFAWSRYMKWLEFGSTAHMPPSPGCTFPGCF